MVRIEAQRRFIAETRKLNPSPTLAKRLDKLEWELNELEKTLPATA
ncbi:hypothetical protein RE0356_14370 [Prescottella equi]|nr:hypothetical protein RE0356_14370 [Prescottella equi]